MGFIFAQLYAYSFVKHGISFHPSVLKTSKCRFDRFTLQLEPTQCASCGLQLVLQLALLDVLVGSDRGSIQPTTKQTQLDFNDYAVGTTSTPPGGCANLLTFLFLRPESACQLYSL